MARRRFKPEAVEEFNDPLLIKMLPEIMVAALSITETTTETTETTTTRPRTPDEVRAALAEGGR